MAFKKKTVQLFYDVISPYSWLGFELLTRYQNVWSSMNLILRPSYLAGVMKHAGNQPPMMVASKGAYMLKDLDRLKNYYKVPVRIPSNFVKIALEIGTLVPMRYITAVDFLSKGTATEAISREFYRHILSRDPSDVPTSPEALMTLSKKAKMDDELIHESLRTMSTSENKSRLISATNDAVSYGAFGLPAIVADSPDGPQLLFGSDRIELLSHILGEKFQGPLVELSKL